MGRLDLNDKPVDFVSVSKGYLDELHTTIDTLKAEIDRLQTEGTGAKPT